jgi:hypothetical protein
MPMDDDGAGDFRLWAGSENVAALLVKTSLTMVHHSPCNFNVLFVSYMY